jgi:hypothetical protein
MRIVAFCIICILVFFCSCRKDESDKIDMQIVFDNIIAYPNDSVYVNFHIEINPDNPSYVVEWSLPDSSVTDSLFSLSLASDYTLKFILKNYDGKQIRNYEYTILLDSILANPKYDFRNYFEGDYLFNIHHVYYSSSHPVGVDTIYIVDGFVHKSGTLQTSFLSFNYGPKVLWTGYYLDLFNYSTFSVSPDNILSRPGESNFIYDPHSYGKFINNDSLMLNISIYGPGMIHDAIYIQGSKK